MRCPKCPVPEITYILPGVSWLFFKAQAKRPYLNHTGRASNAEKHSTGPGPEGCDENGPAAALLVGHVSIEICSAPTASPARTALPAAHFDRNKIHTISGTGHYHERFAGYIERYLLHGSSFASGAKGLIAK